MFFKKQKNSVNRICEQLEYAAQDDMAMFLEFGEEYFTLEELEDMHRGWEREFKLTEKLRGRFVILCTSSLMLIPIAGLFMIAGYGYLIPYLIACFPFVFIAGLAGFLSLYFKFGRIAYQESIGRRLKFAIRNKLKRRGLSKDFES
ncbi:MAG: hypothetical protein AAF573_18495 [Bacteroidota bacterium]